MIKFNQQLEIAFTDGNFIYLHSKFKTDIKNAQGLIAHESGHIGYGSFEIALIKLIKTISKKYSIPEALVKRIINIIEDIRINTINKKKFPGFYKNLKHFTIKLLHKNKLKLYHFLDIFFYINLFMEDYEEFQVKPKFKTINISDYDWKAIDITKKFLLKSLTPSSSIIICDQLCKILKKYIKIRKYKSSIPLRTYKTSELVIRPENENNQEHPEIYESREETKYFDEIDCFEDPVFIENYEPSDNFEINQINGSFESKQDLYINQYDDFMNNNPKYDNTELKKSSEKIIDKIANDNITSEDIEHLVNRLEEIERTNENIKENEKTLDINHNFLDFFESKELLEKQNNETNSCSFNNRYKDDIDDFYIDFNNIKDVEINDKIHKENKNQSIEEIVEIIRKANLQMNQRLIFIETCESIDFSKNKLEKKTIETRIENDNMKPLCLSYNQIINDYKNVITKVKLIFSQYNNSYNNDQFQKTGILNKNLIKTITSDFKFNKCFTRKIKQKELKILLLVDISGSMHETKLESAKIAMIILCEALSNLLKIRIVLFTGENDARNILIKDFNEILNVKKIDKFGHHAVDHYNLDGISIKCEATKLNKNEIIIVISDGQPAGTFYELNDAVFDIQSVRKKFKVFAFSIDALGDYLNLLYGKYWILTNSFDKLDLCDKIIKFCKFVVKEFFI